MKYIIIGLGNYGKMLALELTAIGNEVIGADMDENIVDKIKDSIATAFVMDSTDEHSLSALPLNDVDVVIVTIGENFGASIKTVALLKRRKVEKIYARAIDDVHKAILEAFNIEKILTPEESAAHTLVQLLDFETNIETFRIDKDYAVVKFTVPDRLVGYYVNKLSVQEEFNLKIIGLKRNKKVVNSLGISITENDILNELSSDEKIEAGDKLICYGLYSNFRKFWKTVS
ncbi:MAG: TrkA family potassium uptake protein [Bacteroidales bacterium]